MRLVLSLLLLGAGLTAAAARGEEVWDPAASDLLFSSNRDGNSEVYLIRAGETEWVNLTHHEAGDNWPVWSPDGSRIAFQSKRAGNLDIWTMNADGSDPVQLTSHPEPDYIPAWSPDGLTILFTSWRTESGEEERAPHIYAMNADGSGQRRLIAESLNTSSGATWSADGKRIVYSRSSGKGADLYVADSDGTNERRITFDEDANVYNGSPTFSPDGRFIAFYSDDEKSAALTLIGVDGENRRTILPEGHNWYPHWSPDGHWIVYTATAAGDDEKNIDILAVPVTGTSAPIVLVGAPGRDVEGSWRPR